MTPLNWPRVSTLPWRERNALVEAAVRECLADAYGSGSTEQLAVAISPNSHWGDDHAKIAKLLARLAPHIGPPLATHDGETVTRNGKTWRRWRWHGQRGGTMRGWMIFAAVWVAATAWVLAIAWCFGGGQ